MLVTEFKNLKYKGFNGSENWGDINKVSLDLVMCLDKYKHLLGCDVYISPEKGAVYSYDKNNHLHNMGISAKIYPQCNLLYALNVALQVPEIGTITIYPYDNWKEMKLYGSLDISILTRSNDLKRVTWVDDNNQTNALAVNDHYPNFLNSLCEVFNKINEK